MQCTFSLVLVPAASLTHAMAVSLRFVLYMAGTHLSEVAGGGVGKQEKLVGVGTGSTPPDWRGPLFWRGVRPPVLLREQRQHLLYAAAALGARPQHCQPHLRPLGGENLRAPG